MARKRHVEVFRTRARNADGTPKFAFRVVGANGEKMDQSELYANRPNARRAAKRLYPTLEVQTVR